MSLNNKLNPTPWNSDPIHPEDSVSLGPWTKLFLKFAVGYVIVTNATVGLFYTSAMLDKGHSREYIEREVQETIDSDSTSWIADFSLQISKPGRELAYLIYDK